jgi:hypothetical protein
LSSQKKDSEPSLKIPPPAQTGSPNFDEAVIDAHEPGRKIETSHEEDNSKVAECFIDDLREQQNESADNLDTDTTESVVSESKRRDLTNAMEQEAPTNVHIVEAEKKISSHNDGLQTFQMECHCNTTDHVEESPDNAINPSSPVRKMNHLVNCTTHSSGLLSTNIVTPPARLHPIPDSSVRQASSNILYVKKSPLRSPYIKKEQTISHQEGSDLFSSLPQQPFLPASRVSQHDTMLLHHRSSAALVLIKDVTTSIQIGSQICAGVITKEDIINYNDKNQQQQRFSCDILDTSGITMRVACFGYAVSKFYDKLLTGNVYDIGNFKINEAKYHGNCISNFEMILNSNSVVVHNDQSTLDQIKREITPVEMHVVLISNLALDVYNWIIRATVVEKSAIRSSFSKAGKPWKHFTITLSDASTKNIKASFFNDSVDMFHDLIQFGKSYSFSGGNLCTPDIRYSNATVEIKFRQTSVIELLECHPADCPIAQKFTLIDDLMPNSITNWPICSRVVSKSDLKEYESERFDGVYFTVILRDSSMNDIQATFFNNAANKFIDIIIINNIYVFSGGRVNVSKYQNENSYKYYINFPEQAIVRLHKEWDETIMIGHGSFFHFKNLQLLQEKENHQRPFDVMGIVVNIGEMSAPTDTPGSSTMDVASCDVTVLDMTTQTPIIISLHGKEAQNAYTNLHGNPVVAFCPISMKSVDVNKEFTLLGNIIKSPTGPLAEALLAWWFNGTVECDQHLMSAGNGKPFVNIACNILGNTLLDNESYIPQQFILISQLDKDKEWIICGRLFYKSDLTYKKGTTPGPFCINLLDSSGVDILARFEDEQVIAQYYSILEIGKIYSISKGKLIMPSPYIKSGCASPFEISIDVKAVICPLPTDQVANFFHAFNVLTLEELANHPNKDLKADIVVVVKSVFEMTTNTSGKGNNHIDLLVTDDSGYEFTVTVWNEKADDAIQYCGNPVVAFYPVRIKGYQKNKLSAIGQVYINPNIERTNTLLDWWAKEQKCGESVV